MSPVVATFAKLLPLAGHAGDYQPAAVEHAEELLQLLQGDFLRREFILEAFLDLVQTGPAVEHLEDGVFLLLEAVVVQSDRLLHHPVRLTQVLLFARGQIGSLPERQLPGGTGYQTVGQSGHRSAAGG